MKNTWGLPIMVGRGKKASLNYTKDRVWSKLQSWKEKLLSQARNEVLLKAVVQVIPTLTMSCFRLPIGLCQDIEMLIRKFWWGQWGEIEERFTGRSGKFCVNQTLKGV